jgi:hypothetical protein
VCTDSDESFTVCQRAAMQERLFQVGVSLLPRCSFIKPVCVSSDPITSCAQSDVLSDHRERDRGTETSTGTHCDFGSSQTLSDHEVSQIAPPEPAADHHSGERPLEADMASLAPIGMPSLTVFLFANLSMNSSE